MGEVFRARDARLGREVAVKVFREEVADARALARFELEAKAVAALSHPNILSIFDIGEADGVHYAVTELLEGETLRAALGRGAVPAPLALDIAHRLADALAAAHDKGIVHRDVKPENVFLTRDGRVKLLDFGIAHRQEPPLAAEPASAVPTARLLTQRGAVLGTVSYMSPEQARGELVDFRSDQFSLGIVLYEMLSGTHPFRGASPAETLAAILRAEPPPLERAATGVSAPVRWLVARCLSKPVDDRFDSTRDLARELDSLRAHLGSRGRTRRRRRIAAVWIAAAAIGGAAIALTVRRAAPRGAAEPAAAPRRVVVLPFENLGSREDDYFAAGMTEEITSRLASVGGLAVISRTTATQYDRRGKTVQEIGKDLRVGYVLEGSVRCDHGGGRTRVRITPQLIRVSDDTHLWTDRYDRELADVFAIQGEVAEGVARALDVALARAESSALHAAPTHDLEAYDLYLRALELGKRSSRPADLAEEIALAGAAVARDPQFAEALALVAEARLLSYAYHWDRRASELERARTEAERSVALRPGSAAAHVALGYYHYHGRGDFEAALAEFRRAETLRPNDASVHAATGYVLRRQGKLAESQVELRRALDGDPRNPSVASDLGVTQLLARRYDDALRSFAAASAIDPSYSGGHVEMAWAHVAGRGDLAAAERVLGECATRHGHESPHPSWIAYRLAVMSRDLERALAWVDGLRGEPLGDQFGWAPVSLLRAEALALLGRPLLARAAFEEARTILAEKAAGDPEDARIRSSLGIALAGLGRRDEAVLEGERGAALMPPERDAVLGALRVEDLARIRAMVGDEEGAAAKLEELLSRPGLLSVPVLRLDPRWDALRKNARFQALLAKSDA